MQKVITHDDLFSVFMQNNIEYKGQLCSGYSSRGFGSKVETSVDMGALVAPFVTIEIGGSYAGTKSKQMMVILARMPKSLEAFETKLPIMLSCMKGMRKTHAVTAHVEAGVATPSIFDGLSSDDPAFQSPSLGEPGDVADLLSFELGAKATAKLEGGWKGVWLKLRDLSPAYFRCINDNFLKSDFATMIGPGSRTRVESDILMFFNMHHKFKPLTPKRQVWKHLTGGNVTFQRIEEALNQVEKLLRTDPLFLNDYRLPNYINRLTYHKQQIYAFKEYDFNYFAKTRINRMEKKYHDLNVEGLIERDRNLCFLDLVSHQPEAGASTQVSFGVGALGQGLSSQAGTGMKGTVKTTNYRYQYYGRNESTGDIMIMTQDTNIRYKQLQLFAEIGGEVKLLTKGMEKSKSKEKLVHNSFSYQSGIVYWAPPKKGNKVVTRMGSGVSFGESVLPVNLIKHLRQHKKDKTDKGSRLYLSQLAKVLHVEPADLCEFGQSCQNTLVSFATSCNGGNSSVLIESCFAKDGDRLTVNMLEKDVPELQGGKKSFFKEMANSIAKKTPQCIRLRVRRADVRDDTKVKFKLGIGIPGINTSFGIELLSVEDAGTEAVVDIWTHWFPPYHGYNQTSYNTPSAFVKFMGFDAAVPPVAIFHQ